MRDARIDEDLDVEYGDVEVQAMSLRSGGGERGKLAVIPRPQRLYAAVAVVFELGDPR